MFSKKDQWPHHMTEEEPSISTVCRGACGIFEKGDLKGRLKRDRLACDPGQPAFPLQRLAVPVLWVSLAQAMFPGTLLSLPEHLGFCFISWDHPWVLAEALQPSLLLWFDVLAVS